VAATRCERAALHAVQEQVRRAVWAAAGLRYAHAASWHVKAKPPGAGGGAAGDGFEEGRAGLARLVQTWAALVTAAQASAQARLARLRTHAISPKASMCEHVRACASICGSEKAFVTFETCKAAGDAVVDGGAVALLGNRLVVQLAPPAYRPRPGGLHPRRSSRSRPARRPATRWWTAAWWP
jgi:hypothetical protein